MGEDARRRDVVPVIGGFEVLVAPGWHHAERYPIEANHAWLRDRLRTGAWRANRREGTGVIVGQVFVQKVRRGHDEFGIDAAARRRVAIAGTAELIVHHARTVGA